MPTISQLTATNSVADTDQVPVYSTDNGDARKASMSTLKTYFSSDVNFANVTLTDPVLIDADLGTPIAGNLVNCTGLPSVAYTTGRIIVNPSNDITPSASTSNNFWLYDSSIPANNYASSRFDFTFSGSGGTPGFVSSGSRFNTTVAAGRTDFVWGLLSVLDNSATAGENVAVYGQGNKLTGAGPTWAGVLEARDKSNSANPTTGLVGLEIDVFANGTDANNNRVGVDIVGGKGVAGGARNEIAYGIRIGSVNGVTADSLFYQGYAVTAPAYVGFDCSAAPLEGDKIAFRMANDQWLSFVPTNNRLLGYTTSGLTYSVSGVNTLTYSDTGILNVNTGKFYISAAGRVGIGTITPAEALDVVGNVFLSGQSTADQAIRIGKGRTGNGLSYLDLQGDATYVDGLRLIRNNGGANTSSSLIHRGTGTLNITAQEAGAITLNTTNLERVRVDTVGNVGIGTSTPLSATNFKFVTVQGGSNGGGYSIYDSAGVESARLQADPGKFAIYNYSATLPTIFYTNNIARLRILANGDVVNTSTGGLGYGTGSGGVVTQLTSRTTSVTLDKTNGAITLFSAAGSATATTFTVTNSTIAATDVVHVSVKSATNVYLVFVTATATGSFNVTFQTTGGTAVDAPVFNFAVIKAVTA